MRKRAKNPVETTEVQKKIKVKQSVSINYHIQLNEEQKDAKRHILENAITIITGKAGSGKTQVGILTALDLLFKGAIDKIFITRPMVTRENLGYLPGDIKDKLDPILIPIYDCMESAVDKEKIDKAILNKEIEIAPIAYMRGRTIKRAVLIIDEAQNIDDESMKMCLTRLGKEGKIIICGDVGQIDLKDKNLSGLHFLTTLEGRVPSLKLCDLKINHRHPLIDALLNCYEARDKELMSIKLISDLTRRKAS